MNSTIKFDELIRLSTLAYFVVITDQPVCIFQRAGFLYCVHGDWFCASKARCGLFSYNFTCSFVSIEILPFWQCESSAGSM